jgi:putative heme-binding domain-containing protein
MRAARRLGRGELDQAERLAMITAAEKLPDGPIRDLFEGYLPVQNAADRRLGSNPRPQSILALAGDSSRGEQLFWSEKLECGKCHQIGERGTAVGPELTSIGARRSKDELLDSLLMPSRRIEPDFATQIVQLDDGRVVTGVIAKRDSDRIVLRTADGKDVEVTTDHIEQQRPSAASLMPSGQVSGLTAQQAADLLEYLRLRSVDQSRSAR